VDDFKMYLGEINSEMWSGWG